MRVHSYLIVAFAFLTASILSEAHAAPITYTLTGTMNGSLGETSFTNAAFSWTIASDTTLKQAIGSGITALPAQAQSLGITGVGSVTPTPQIFAGDFPPSGAFVFTDVTVFEGIAFSAPQFLSYDGFSSIGPIAALFDHFGPLPTAQGDLTVATASDLVFQATVTESAVPEPITLALFGAGLAGAAAMRRRKAII